MNPILAFCFDRTGMKVPKKISGKTRKTPKQMRSIETANFVLLATAQFLQQHDYAKLSTNKVAALAGVSIGTLYQYFSSKEDVMVALIHRQLDEDVSAIQNVLEDNSAPCFQEAVRKVTQTLIRMYSEQAKLRFAIYVHVREFSMLEVWESFQRRVRQVILDNFEKHSQGEYEIPSDLSVYILIQAVRGALRAAAKERVEALRQKEFENHLTNLILSYFSSTALKPVR